MQQVELEHDAAASSYIAIEVVLDQLLSNNTEMQTLLDSH